MAAKLTVLITCKNEERHIVDCIRSVRGVADEILVADSGSTDRTLELVRALGGCRIIEREYRYPADFKNWAIPQASHEWVLIVDADERLTEELATSIRTVLSDPSPKYTAYRTAFDCYFFGRHLKYAGWNSTAIRLIRRRCRYRRQRVHEEIDLPPKQVGRLKGRVLHYSIESYDQYFEKYLHYTQVGADTLFDRGKRATFASLLLRPLLRFLQLYLLRGGFLDGLPGLQACMLTAFFNTFVKQARLWELQQGAIESVEEAGSKEVVTEEPAEKPIIIRFPQQAMEREEDIHPDSQPGISGTRVSA